MNLAQIEIYARKVEVLHVPDIEEIRSDTISTYNLALYTINCKKSNII